MMLDLRQIFEIFGESMVLDTTVTLDVVDNSGVNLFETPITVSGNIENKLGVVYMHYRAGFKLHYLCDRCLSDEHRDFTMTFSHILVNDREVDFSDERIEVQGTSLDLDDLVMNDILLELPVKLLCKDDCKGLCTDCGKNLNEGACSCNHKEIDPRLAVLGQLLNHDD